MTGWREASQTIDRMVYLKLPFTERSSQIKILYIGCCDKSWSSPGEGEGWPLVSLQSPLHPSTPGQGTIYTAWPMWRLARVLSYGLDCRGKYIANICDTRALININSKTCRKYLGNLNNSQYQFTTTSAIVLNIYCLQFIWSSPHAILTISKLFFN